MRKQVSIIATALVLAVPVADAAAAVTHTKAVKKVVTKKLNGTPAQADRWGQVTVNVTVRLTTVGKKTTRKYLDLGGSYTYHTDRSQYIMSQALPILRQEFLQAQTSNVQMVSGATYTSQAFEQSLQSALSKL
ncbi:MAG: FMN-binding protein [Actinobacteria bacterium]|nr:FMN-binding protein [Actinomycetota bacterium]MBV8396791.1 FMN-binding protein [Actinomycetota bacterium]